MKTFFWFCKWLSTGLIFFEISTAYALPPIVYRAASQLDRPQAIKAAGGFLPRGADGSRPRQPPPNISLLNHVTGLPGGMSRYDSGYVATTQSISAAMAFIGENLRNYGYIYHIRPSMSFYDVNGILREYSPHRTEQEFAALGTIHWDQVIGWEEIRAGRTHGYVQNPDYRPHRYPYLPNITGIDYELAGFPADHPAWQRAPWRQLNFCQFPFIDDNSRPTRSVIGYDTCPSGFTLDANTLGKKVFYRNYAKENAKLFFLTESDVIKTPLSLGVGLK